MATVIQRIPLSKLLGHPANANRMSSANFRKLKANIEKTKLYEPLIVRRHKDKKGCFEILNGHHRCKALGQLGHSLADCVIWDVDDSQAEVLLLTLNRLCGSDDVDKKIELLKSLNKKLNSSRLAKLLPQTKDQIEKLVNMEVPKLPVDVAGICFANPLVFFVNDMEKRIIENAIALASDEKGKLTRAQANTMAVVKIAEHYIDNNNREK